MCVFSMSLAQAAESGPGAVPLSLAWWQSANDPVLPAMADRTLSSNKAIACRVSTLARADAAMASRERRLGTRIARILGAKEDPVAENRRAAIVTAIAQRRAQLAEDLALSLIEARRLQRRSTAIATTLGPYRDNAEIAGFRRQAGLVPALDETIAGTQEAAARAELDAESAALRDAIGRLAALAGETSDAITARLAAGPEPGATLLATARATRRSPGLEAARRAVRDARTGYREGTGTIATLYVAEAAVLSLELAQIDAQARAASDDVRSRSRADTAWARSGLEPADIAVHAVSERTPGAPFCD